MNLLNKIRSYFKPIDIWLERPRKSVLKCSLSTTAFIDDKKETEEQSPILMYQHDTTNITWDFELERTGNSIKLWNNGKYIGEMVEGYYYHVVHTIHLEFGYPAKFSEVISE